MRTSKTYVIETEPQRCTGCRRCQFICSFQHTGEFNPSRTNIIISEDGYGVTDIRFTPNCDLCNICIQYCVYGALTLKRIV